mmetsp:Transcript_13883/g.54839  ORF Transcript_13883/g.54839 Transcript_13883/m.54839 type:complete len:208 (-) Transcript_13883:879-1502(-)
MRRRARRARQAGPAAPDCAEQGQEAARLHAGLAGRFGDLPREERRSESRKGRVERRRRRRTVTPTTTPRTATPAGAGARPGPRSRPSTRARAGARARAAAGARARRPGRRQRRNRARPRRRRRRLPARRQAARTELQCLQKGWTRTRYSRGSVSTSRCSLASWRRLARAQTSRPSSASCSQAPIRSLSAPTWAARPSWYQGRACAST